MLAVTGQERAATGKDVQRPPERGSPHRSRRQGGKTFFFPAAQQ